MPITFEDSRPHPQGVRLGDLKVRDTYLPYPCSPLSDVAEVTKQTADNCTVIRWFDSAAGGMCCSDTVVYPVAVKMVRVDQEENKDSLILNEPWDALAKLRDELAKVKAERDQAIKNQDYLHVKRKVDSDAYLSKCLECEDLRKLAKRTEAVEKELRLMINARNAWMANCDEEQKKNHTLTVSLEAAKTERDAWKARSEALSKSVVYRGSSRRYSPVTLGSFQFSTFDEATSYYDKVFCVPPAPSE